jgi:hypothetical protein
LVVVVVPQTKVVIMVMVLHSILYKQLEVAEVVLIVELLQLVHLIINSQNQAAQVEAVHILVKRQVH